MQTRLRDKTVYVMAYNFHEYYGAGTLWYGMLFWHDHEYRTCQLSHVIDENGADILNMATRFQYSSGMLTNMFFTKQAVIDRAKYLYDKLLPGAVLLVEGDILNLSPQMAVWGREDLVDVNNKFVRRTRQVHSGTPYMEEIEREYRQFMEQELPGDQTSG